MGTSFVSVNGEHGFWMRDSTLELWLRLLTLHIPEPTDNDSPATHQLTRQIRDQWLLASKGYFGGCVPDGMEDAASTEQGSRIVRAAIQSLLRALESAPQLLNKDVLNLLGIEGVTFFDMETYRLVEVGHAFLGLLNGEIKGTASSTAFMPGSTPVPNQSLR